MFTNLPATGGTLRKSRILTSERQLGKQNLLHIWVSSWTWTNEIEVLAHGVSASLRAKFQKYLTDNDPATAEWNRYSSPTGNEHAALNDWRSKIQWGNLNLSFKLVSQHISKGIWNIQYSSCGITVLWTWHSCCSPCGEVMTYHFVWFRNHTVWAQMRLNHLANVQLDKDVCLLSDCSWSWAGGLEILGWVNTSQSLVCSAPWTVLVYFQTRFYVFLCVCFSFWWYASTEVLLLLWGCNLTSSFLLWDKTMSWIVSISPWYDSTTLSLRPNGIWDEFIFNLMMTPEVKTTNTNLWCTNTNTDPSSY